MRAASTMLSLTLLAGAAVAQEGPATYSSAAHGFSFAVPEGLAAREWAPGAVFLERPGKGESPDILAEVELMAAGEGEDFSAWEPFALARLRNACAADGPGETIFCTKPEQRQPFVTDAGLAGEILYMRRARRNFDAGTKAVDGWGPIILFDVSDAIPGDGWAALAVEPPFALEAGEVDSALLRAVAASLSVGGG